MNSLQVSRDADVTDQQNMVTAAQEQAFRKEQAGISAEQLQDDDEVFVNAGMSLLCLCCAVL